MRHEWEEKGRRFTLNHNGELVEHAPPGEAPQVGEVPAPAKRLIDRLAEENRTLREVRDLFAAGPDALEAAILARVRRELKEALGFLDETTVDLGAILDRICPEE